MNILKKLQRALFGDFVSKRGIIEFTTGDHEVFIKIRFKRHERVWIHICEEEHHPHCSYVDRDMFSVSEIFNDGFVIVAHVESNERKVFWYIR